MGEFSLPHLLVLVLVLLLFFGPSKLPALGQSLGKAIRGFKEGMNEMNANAKDVTPESLPPQANTGVASAQTETKKEPHS